jgi:hypothetical protein
MSRQRLIALVAFTAFVGLMSCATARGNRMESTPTRTDSLQGTLIDLQRRQPADSVVLHRGGATILLSMRDVEDYFAQWPLPPDVQRFREELARQYSEEGWAELGEGFLEDMLASQLLQRGRAVVRPSGERRLLRSVRTLVEREVAGSTVVRQRSFYLPTGLLLLRVPDGVTISH